VLEEFTPPDVLQTRDFRRRGSESTARCVHYFLAGSAALLDGSAALFAASEAFLVASGGPLRWGAYRAWHAAQAL